MSLNPECKRVAFYTLGCKVNQQETDSLRMLFEQRGYTAVAFEDYAEVYVINTCTVTQTSDKKSRQAISRAHAQNQDAKIVVVGCYAQRKPEDIARIPGVVAIIGTQHRAKIVDLVEQAEAQRNTVEELRAASVFETLPTAIGKQGWEGRTRAQLKIQDGCDRYCSYCIIPYARGPIRSRAVEEIRQELSLLSAQGMQEVVLTGIHLMSYGKENAALPALTEIIRMGTSMPGIGRIRLGSLEPALVNMDFVESLRALPQGKLCGQFHLSLQSGCDAVLSCMRRRYTAAEYAEAAQLLREAFPGCALTTDIIAGFPGETQQEHCESMAFIERMAFARIHVFPYSRREGTAAYSLPDQVQKAVKEQRAKELLTLGKAMEQAYIRAQIGSVLHVLPETEREGMLEGYAGNYVRVRYAGTQASITPVRIQSAEGSVAIGEALI